jgi:Zn-dependent oligopeptidase
MGNFDANGEGLALFYGDYFSRDSKSGGAWMDVFVEQSTLLAASGDLQRLQLPETEGRPQRAALLG